MIGGLLETVLKSPTIHQFDSSNLAAGGPLLGLERGQSTWLWMRGNPSATGGFEKTPKVLLITHLFISGGFGGKEPVAFSMVAHLTVRRPCVSSVRFRLKWSLPAVSQDPCGCQLPAQRWGPHHHTRRATGARHR